MKILNLGSSGQIGAYLSAYLRTKGHTVIDFDKEETQGSQLTIDQITDYNPYLGRITEPSHNK